MSIINPNFRITGLASGLDTEQMVKDLMAVERLPLTRLEQKGLTRRQEAYLFQSAGKFLITKGRISSLTRLPKCHRRG